MLTRNFREVQPQYSDSVGKKAFHLFLRFREEGQAPISEDALRENIIQSVVQNTLKGKSGSA